MFKSLLFVGVGSFIGGVLRYSVSVLMKGLCGQGFPWGTLLVNLVWCFAFGVIFALFGRYGSTNSGWCLLLTTGVCGGFTTFSIFSLEAYSILSIRNYGLCGLYVSYNQKLWIA